MGKRVAYEFKHHRKQDEAVETTNSFKLVRSMEAVFESIPQCVLQLVFIIRTNGEYEGDGHLLLISCLSIGQSIISMTNSILKQDNQYMNFPRFKKHRQRLPPSPQFVGHALCRLSEILNRICCLSLLWSICGGTVFSAVMGLELFYILPVYLILHFDDFSTENLEKLFHAALEQIQCIVVLPPEAVFETGLPIEAIVQFMTDVDVICCFFWAACIFCCYIPALFATLCCVCSSSKEVGFLTTIRIGTTFTVWILIILCGLFPFWFDEPNMFLLGPYDTFSFAVFIVGLVMYIVYTQYLWLTPDYTLPFEVSIRSKWGYAFNGELEELQRITMIDPYGWDEGLNAIVKATSGSVSKMEDFRTNWYTPWQHYSKKEAEDVGFTGNWLQSEIRRLLESRPPGKYALFALANGHYEVAEWLEEQGAKHHIELFKAQEVTNDLSKQDSSRTHIDPDGKYFAAESAACFSFARE